MAPQVNDAENEHDENDQLRMSPEEADRLLDDDSDDEPDPRPRRAARDDSDDDEDEGLGDRGRRALEAEKQRRKAARAELSSTRQKLEAAQRELENLQSGNKTELQRLVEERDALRDQLSTVSSKAKRRDIAEEFAPEHATAAHIRFVSKYLTGSSDEELQDSAEELFAQVAPEPAKPKTPQRPKEKLRGGGDPEEDDLETDPRKLADMIRSNRGIF